VSGPYDRPRPLTPDEVERQGFAIEHRGYDRDQVRAFLFEVAAALRLALQSTQPPPSQRPGPPPWARSSGAGPGALIGGPSPADPTFEAARIVREAKRSAAILQGEAEESAAAIIEQARQDAAAIEEQARQDADELLSRAAEEGEELRDKARRVLVDAQEEARQHYADAERRARRLLRGAKQDALNHAQKVSLTLEARTNQLLEAEQTILARLNETRLQLSDVIEALAGAEPVVGPTVEILRLAVDARAAGEPSLPASSETASASEPDEADDAPPPDAPSADAAPPDDGVARMVHAAVTRARESAAALSTGEMPVITAATATAVAEPDTAIAPDDGTAPEPEEQVPSEDPEPEAEGPEAIDSSAPPVYTSDAASVTESTAQDPETDLATILSEIAELLGSMDDLGTRDGTLRPRPYLPPEESG
jgi:DivIVA domain-containing protein